MSAAEPPAAIVALGSNLGDSVSLIQSAFGKLQELSGEPIRKSSLWRSSPVDCPPGSPPFINAVAAISPRAQTPEELLHRLLEIERELGRTRKTVHNEPRPIDLDLIAFGKEIRSTPSLMLPHPRAHLRRFVLAPMSEVASEFVLPGQERTVSELLKDLPSSDKVDPL